MSNVEDAKTNVENELDELDSFLYDLEGYISQMRSMISDAQQCVDDEDGADSIISELGNIQMTANELSYDTGNIDSLVGSIEDAARDLREAIEEEEKEEVEA